MNKHRALWLVVAAALVLPAAKARSHRSRATPPAPHSMAENMINDSWYTMQAGSTPFGYFHEVIESRDGKYAYRYAMTKFENSQVYEENIGALAQADLAPIAFNLNKSGAGATESTNASYSPTKYGGEFSLTVSGAKVASFKRATPKDVILDVFFPVWLVKQWEKLKPGYRGWVNTFSEDPDRQEFRTRMVKFEVKNFDSQLECLHIKYELESLRGDWCTTSKGVLVDLNFGSYHVHRVSSEQEAKSFLAGVMPKKKQEE